jgi:inosose dehydratase
MEGLKLAGAPITWGICEVPGWGEQLDRDRVLSEIRASGLSATELGPRGFLPTDPRDLQVVLDRYDLELIAGFVPAVLHREESLADALSEVEESAKTLSGSGADILVLAAETGDTGYESSARLTDAEWATLSQGIASVKEIGARHNLLVTLHPHYGTVIESDEQIREVLSRTDVDICLDTGHLMVAGADPLAIARAANGRIAHVHLKDVDKSLAKKVQGRELGYRDAVKAGMYKPLGDGDVDLRGVIDMLTAAAFDGWFVIEQDLVFDSNGSGTTPLQNAERSVRFIERVMES